MRPAGTGIIIDDNKRILLLKRSDYTSSFPYHWTMPGGRGEVGENPEEIVVREIKEETGLNFNPTRLYYDSKQENSGEMTHAHRFLGEWSGNIQIQEEEALGYAWYTYEEAITLKIAFDYADIIEKLHNDGLLD